MNHQLGSIGAKQGRFEGPMKIVHSGFKDCMAIKGKPTPAEWKRAQKILKLQAKQQIQKYSATFT